jgi:peptidoglycan/xylan/chitin deacetylase (PgdA/CDA1 family)
MEWLSNNKPVVSMKAVAEAYRNGSSLPEGAIVVTFDDGFLNNYTDAWPILEEFGLPATFYLATGFIGTGRMVWSDILEANIIGSDLESISLDFPDGPLVWPLRSTEERIVAFLGIKEICKKLPNSSKDVVMAQVKSRSNANVASDHPLYAFMSWDNVRAMNKSSLVDFGAHTVDHVSLAKVPEEIMIDQIDTSTAELEKNTGQKCDLFSYPEGQKEDYNSQVISHLKARNFDHSPTAIDGVNDLASVGPFDMKRMMVGFEDRAFPFADI